MSLTRSAAASPVPAPIPVEVRHPVAQTVPVVFASPHSGRDYPQDFVAAARLDMLGLRRSEDSFVDELFAAAPSQGAPLLLARFPRAYCDANREAWELDPTMFAGPLPDWVNTTSARVGAGLGTIARIVASGEPIYRSKLDFAEARARVAQCWQPFHDALQAEIAATRARFGQCLLIDCHSMPGISQARGARADIVLGDAHGTSCAPSVVRRIEQCLAELGFRVRRNDPYAGGYITRHYGRPREGCHAVQVEICRSLYMDEARIERLPGFPTIAANLTGFITALAGAGGFLPQG
jgi:N-formylglutamate deformylase